MHRHKLIFCFTEFSTVILPRELRNEPTWTSGNPFTFYNELPYNISAQCVYLKYTINFTENFKDNKNIWKYLLMTDCEQIINQTYIVCECHHKLQLEEDIVIKPLNRPDTSGFVNHRSIFSRLPKSQTYDLDCTYPSYSSYEKEYYYCKGTKHIASVLSYVQVTFLKKSDDYDCKFKCIGFLTVSSETNINFSIPMFDSYCRSREINVCSSNQVNLLQEIPIVSCKTRDTFSPKCLYLSYEGCADNSHLENCENFQCPDGFIKCPNSYCISFFDVRDGIRQCPLGQEKAIFTQNKEICFAEITYKFNQFCLYADQSFPSLIFLRNFPPYICNHTCPMDYNCFSYGSRYNLNRLLKENTQLYNISNSLIPHLYSYFFYLFLQIIEINVSACKIRNLGKALEHWNTEEIVTLDLSNNEISDREKISPVSSMTHLIYLNLSRNVLLRINGKFAFPNTLEVIDLSYTSVESLPENLFKVLHSLRMLDLSYTKIHKFENMGLPRYFTLDILNIEGVMMTDITADFYQGLTVNTSLMSSDFKLCCPQILGKNILSGKCHAPDDAISSCKHIVGDTLKRILVWVVGLMTIAGNGIVLIYRVVWNRENIFQTAYGLFVTGLAVSDLLMGVYLMIIAVVDVVYADVYVVYDESWRKSFLCNFSGFLSTLSSETSTFLIGLITLDRFISISYPFSAHDTSTSLKWKGFISTWVIGFVLALIPAVVPEWQIYSSNGLYLALPLRTAGSDQLPGWEFSLAIYVILNFILFLFIALGQVGIFVNAMKTRNLPSMRHCSERRTQDMNIAKKLAFVAVSDFLCWFPIGIMGILSLIGQEFDKETYAWMAVFVLPVNSALNPMIYTIPVIIDRLKFKT
ncbi:hypothetical protein Btru_008349 [Bulinus truncatus]|nr:hypothetical protein Btru_008349 [Bulinus truncatus]